MTPGAFETSHYGRLWAIQNQPPLSGLCMGHIVKLEWILVMVLRRAFLFQTAGMCRRLETTAITPWIVSLSLFCGFRPSCLRPA
jgi:hypothetical protein